ncbi:hypothetical protein EV667_3846 [Ancylobacter aquaticus]|uniref:Uncharacterized protein n=1 Tax=Ancylobacter aquaticus TaxID=100 RepID=A0A4R1HTH0_ANCAQ|nr:hypothetical protein [Ancylobacter aquaticus]TCK23169.1 hypothetical protein EV667_3846 [Ancylobacter aquaticus]
MADYYPLIARAIGGLPEKTGEARKAVYERARRALLAQLTAVDPPLSQPDVAREQQALETAISRAEADFSTVAPPPAAAPPPRAPSWPPAGLTPAAPPAAPPAASAPPPAASAPSAPVSPPPVPPVPAPPPAARAPLTAPPAPSTFPAAAPPARTPERPFERAAEPTTGFHPTEAEAVAAGLEPPRSAGGSSDWRREATRLVREREAEEAAYHAGAEEPSAHEPAAAEVPPPAKGGRGRLVAILVFLLLLIAGGVVGYTQRETIVALINGAGGVTSSPSAEAPATSAPADAAKSTDRIVQADDVAAPAASTAPQAGSAAGTAIGAEQRAVLFEESPGGGEQGLQQYVGTVEWSTESASASDGQPADIGVRAEISIPARNVSATLTFRRNQDPSIPASHILEIQFKLPAGFDLGSISSVPGMRAKASEGAQGAPLVGLAVRVAPNYFLVGLSSLPADVQRNLGFIITRNWLDLPLVFENGRRAILVLEKGGAGDQAFREAFTAWGLPVGPAQNAN